MPRSSVIATSSRKPAIASVHSDGTPSTLSATLIVCSSSAPSAAPTTLPLPPKIATPPTTTAAMTWSSRPLAAVASIVLYCVAQKTPPRPAIAPDSTKAKKMRLAIGIPASRAASGSEPIAYSSRPDRYERR